MTQTALPQQEALIRLLVTAGVRVLLPGVRSRSGALVPLGSARQLNMAMRSASDIALRAARGSAAGIEG